MAVLKHAYARRLRAHWMAGVLLIGMRGPVTVETGSLARREVGMSSFGWPAEAKNFCAAPWQPRDSDVSKGHDLDRELVRSRRIATRAQGHRT